MIWIAFAFLTAFAIFSVLWPLARSRRVATHAQSSREFYQAQLREIKSDFQRGMLDEKEAKIAETEAARRLIASDVPTKDFSANTFNRRSAAIVALICLPAVSMGLYLGLGSPGYQDRPLQARLDARPKQINLVAAVAKIEQHLALNPNDGDGWQILAPIYMRMNRAADSVRAWRNVIRIKKESAKNLIGLGEALVAVGGGKVPSEAVMVFRKSLTLNEKNWQARFYLGLAAEQAGDFGKARKIWTAVLNSAPAGVPWRKVLQSRIAALDSKALRRKESERKSNVQKPSDLTLGGKPTVREGPDTKAGQAIKALPQAQRRAAIDSMVEGLATRLEKHGGSVEEWNRLVRSYVVLAQPEKAAVALKNARKAFAGKPEKLLLLNRQAKALGLGG